MALSLQATSSHLQSIKASKGTKYSTFLCIFATRSNACYVRNRSL